VSRTISTCRPLRCTSTEDGRFTLKEVECLGACGGAPMFQIGRQYYENLTPELIDSILENLEADDGE